MIYPTPPPYSCHAYENNDVTSIMPRNTCENKQLTSQSLTEIRPFAPEMQKFVSAGEAQGSEVAIASNHSCDCSGEDPMGM